MRSTPTIWSTLRHRQFRALWGSGGVYFIGNAMQVMAAAWLMVELTGSAFLAALVQTAVFLPMFLLSLPAGVLADITDRRRLILAALLTQAVAGALLAALLFAGVAGPARCCSSPSSPAAARRCCRRPGTRPIADSVPRDELPQAITAVGDRLQRRARGRPGAGRRGVRDRRRAGCSCSRWSARC